MIWFKTDKRKRASKTSDKKKEDQWISRNTNKKHGGGGDGNWKKKSKKAIKSPQGLNYVISVIAEEKKINSSLVAALKLSAALIYNDADAATVGYIAAAMDATNLNLQIILKDITFKWLGPSHNSGEEITSSSAHPNDHVIKAVISTTQAYKCVSFLGPGTSDSRSELYSHANIVVLGNHYLVFEKK